MNESWKNPAKHHGPRLDFGHLGGTSTQGDPDSWYPELWHWLTDTFGVRSVLDVGCGVGHSMQWFLDRGLPIVAGLDCQQVLDHHVLKDDVVQMDHLVEDPMVLLYPHDLTHGSFRDGDAFDMVWCCEVAEHVEEAFVDNVIHTLARNTRKVLAFCASPKGAGGHHHVNCQHPRYWIDRIEAAGLKYDDDLTDKAVGLCHESYGRGPYSYFRRSGLIFTR